VASNITWGQELFRLVCHMLKSHKVSYVPITAITSNPTVLVYHFYRNEPALNISKINAMFTWALKPNKIPKHRLIWFSENNMHAIRNYIFNVDHMKIADFPMMSRILFGLSAQVNMAFIFEINTNINENHKEMS
jgi:hypothetical protein